ncbi:kinesin [Thraustotheca clavata]|uniref:Kinesin-like protein n=1 Tax=Thraustotheca clavata TaxID=74557 RepID=A0A1W0A2L5_9STRA|nr:kinesin [Thraustotheca clavata]
MTIEDRNEDTLAQQECVRVIVRVRPTNARELKENPPDVVALQAKNSDIPNHILVKSSSWDVDVGYTYDAAFGTSTTQEVIYNYLQSSVEQVVQGFNCTIFAYGQTAPYQDLGTGKTHTMMGPDNALPLQEGMPLPGDSGVIPRAVNSIFQELKTVGLSGAGAVVHCSYMQIYNNQVYDLLQASNVHEQKPLQVREMIKGNAKHIYVSGISEFRVANANDVMQLLKLGSQNRTIRATECNEKSSRSHALLQVNIEVESRGSESTTIIRRAKLNLVDLAGSEKWDTDIVMSNDRTRELRNINASLSALGNVIAALTDKKRTHIPYRDSKLTRLLQDSLGGNTRTIVIATISPSEAAIEETLSTLQFAERAKQISLNIQVNEVVDDAILLARAQKEIAKLEQLLQAQPNKEQLGALEAQVASLQEELKAVKEENQQLKLQLQSQPGQLPPTPQNEGIIKKGIVQQESQLSLTVSPAITQQEEASVDSELRTYDVQAQQQLNQLHRLQSERRQLEAQLQAMQEPQPFGPEDDELCPMCQRVIDHHTDTELDHCIELETQASEPQSRPKSSDSTASLPAIQRPSSKASFRKEVVSPYLESNILRENVKSPAPVLSKHPVPLKPKVKTQPSIVKQLKARQKAKEKLAASPYVDGAKKQDTIIESNQTTKTITTTVLSNDVRDIGLNLTIYSYR